VARAEGPERGAHRQRGEPATEPGHRPSSLVALEATMSAWLASSLVVLMANSSRGFGNEPSSETGSKAPVMVCPHLPTLDDAYLLLTAILLRV
jgi:hypothetical protein